MNERHLAIFSEGLGVTCDVVGIATASAPCCLLGLLHLAFVPLYLHPPSSTTTHITFLITVANMVQHYARIASSFGHAATKVAARAMGAENLATRYSSLGRRDAMPAEEMDPEMQKRFQAMMESIPAWGVATLIATAILGMVMIASVNCPAAEIILPH